MAEKYPNMSPYNYVLNNSLILIDPDGKQTWVMDNAQDGAKQYRYDPTADPHGANATANGTMIYGVTTILNGERSASTVDLKLLSGGKTELLPKPNSLEGLNLLGKDIRERGRKKYGM
jgi:hypothetical protein